MSGATRLLITSVGSLVATNLFEALRAIGRERFFVIGANSEAEAVNNFECDVVYRVPPAGAGEAYRAALLGIGRREAPELWIPARDDDVLELAALAGELPGTVLAGPPQAAEIVCDKWLSYCFALERGLSAAPTALDPDAARQLAARHGYPLVVKPRRGAGSIGARFVADGAQLERAMARGGCVAQRVISPAPDWQERLPDPAAGWPLWYSYVDPGQYASQWMVAPDGNALEIGATLNTMVCGRPERSRRIDDPALSAVAGGFARALAEAGWRGPLNVQCRRDADGGYYMFELAGRFAGGLGGREALGLPETRTVLAAVFPDRFAAPEPAPCGTGLTIKRLQTVGLEADALAQLRRDGVWRRCS
jgi:hypothetical protein